MMPSCSHSAPSTRFRWRRFFIISTAKPSATFSSFASRTVRAIADSDRCPVAERLYERGFYIPSGMALTEEQIRTVAATVRRVLNP